MSEVQKEGSGLEQLPSDKKCHEALLKLPVQLQKPLETKWEFHGSTLPNMEETHFGTRIVIGTHL